MVNVEEPKPYRAPKPAAVSVKQTKDLEADRQRNSDALRRQLAQTDRQRAVMEYDLVPDILRLRVSNPISTKNSLIHSSYPMYVMSCNSHLGNETECIVFPNEAKAKAMTTLLFHFLAN